jgi:hypothetical protein
VAGSGWTIGRIGARICRRVSLVGVTGAQFNFGRGLDSLSPDTLSYPLDRDQYHFDEVILETIPTAHAECASIIRPILDQIANAAGNATNQGHYIPLKRSQ